MNLLVIDSSSSFLQIALKTRDKGGLSYTFEQPFCLSNRYLAEAINFLRNQSCVSLEELDLLIGAEGPGSFTGLRVGMALIKGLSCALYKPFVFVNTLDALSFPYLKARSPLLSVIDARKERVYSALYVSGQRVSPYWDIKPDLLVKELQSYGLQAPITLVGNAGTKLQECSGDVWKFQRVRHDLDTLSGLEALGIQKFLQMGSDAPGRGLFYIRDSDAVPSVQA